MSKQYKEEPDLYAIEGKLIDSYGIFGKCSCGGNIHFYTNRGVKCSDCDKILWV